MLSYVSISLSPSTRPSLRPFRDSLPQWLHPTYITIYLPTHLPNYLPTYLPKYLPTYLTPTVPPSITTFFRPSVPPSAHVCVPSLNHSIVPAPPFSMHTSDCSSLRYSASPLALGPFLHPFLPLCICYLSPTVRPSIYPSLHLPIQPSVLPTLPPTLRPSVSSRRRSLVTWLTCSYIPEGMDGGTEGWRKGGIVEGR